MDDNQSNDLIQKEENINTIQENLLAIFNKDTFIQLDSTKWEDKKEAFTKIEKGIQSNPNITSQDFLDLFYYLKSKLKKFKETNIFLLKDSLSIFSLILKKGNNNNEMIRELLDGFYEKFSEPKLTNDIEKLFQLMLTINQDQLFDSCFLKLSKEKKIPLLIAFSSFFDQIIQEKGLMKIKLDSIISFCIMLSNNPNPQLRSNALKLLCQLYTIIGRKLRQKIGDIKESTRKLIEDAFNRLDAENINSYLNTSKSDTSPDIIEDDKNISQSSRDNNITNSNKKTQFETIDYQKIISAIEDGKWSEKKEALDKLESDIERILSNDKKNFPIEDFIFLIKDKLRDKNQKLVLGILSLLYKVIDILKTNFKAYSDVIALPLINNLNDNKEQVRQSVIMCLEKWVQYIGYESILIYLLNALQIEKYDLRLEVLKFLNKNKDKMKKAIDLLVSPLLICLQDKSNVIRNITEEMIQWTLENGLIKNDYYEKLSNLKPAIAENLKGNIEKMGSCNEKYNKKYNLFSINLLSCISDRELNSHTFQNTTSCQFNMNSTAKASNQSQTLKIDSVSKKKRTTSRDVSPSSSQSADKYYKTESNFIKMKIIRNEKDQKLKLNFDSLKNEYNDNELSLFLSDSFIQKTLQPKTFIDIVKVLIVLIDKDSFKQYFYPNYDLSLKYIIKQLQNEENLIEKVLVVIEQYMKKLLNQFILNDLSLDYIESVLTLELLLNLFDKNTILKKYMDIISIEKSYEIMLDYGLQNSVRMKKTILELFKEDLTNGRINLDNIMNIKLLAKYLYATDTKQIVIVIFKSIESIIGNNQLKRILSQLNSNDKDIILINLDKQEEDVQVKIIKSQFKKTKDKQDNKSIKISFTHKQDIESILTNINEAEKISVKIDNLMKISKYYNDNTSFTQEQHDILLSCIDVSVQTILYEIESFCDINDLGSSETQTYIKALIDFFIMITVNKEYTNKIADDTINNGFITLFNYLQMDQEKSIPKEYVSLLNQMNTIVLNLIENSNLTSVIVILLDIAEKNKEDTIGILAVNCLLNLNQYIGIILSQLSIGSILNKMNEILDNYEKEEMDNVLVIKMIKKLLFELIKHKNSDIIEDYDNSISDNEIPDKYLADWIDQCLMELNKKSKNDHNKKNDNNSSNTKSNHHSPRRVKRYE